MTGRKWTKRVLIGILCVALLGAVAAFGCSFYMVQSTGEQIAVVFESHDFAKEAGGVAADGAATGNATGMVDSDAGSTKNGDATGTSDAAATNTADSVMGSTTDDAATGIADDTAIGTDAAGSALSGMDELLALDADCILVLGAGLKPDGTPNHMLEDRLEAALWLYEQGVAPKLLLTGDHGQERYDEVSAMRKYMEDAGVPAEDIFLDHAGFSTYDSMYRAAHIFEVRRAVVVTQTYHQYRALYLCREFGIEALGAAADQARYHGQLYRDLREIAARDKDFLKALAKPSPRYEGEIIPISGDAV